jgi:hypothetical protein
MLCDAIGLHHQSIPKTKGKKHLYVYLPKLWKWEFTAKNPYSEHQPEYYAERRKQAEERLKRKYCYKCNKNGMEVDLFCSPYTNKLYCE